MLGAEGLDCFLRPHPWLTSPLQPTWRGLCGRMFVEGAHSNGENAFKNYFYMLNS